MTCFKLLFIVLIFGILGCATAPPVMQPAIYQQPGIYHKVASGETLWRISKVYGVDLEQLVKVNRIPDASVIEKGQLIFIPGAKSEKSVVASAALTSFSWPVKGKIISYFGSVLEHRVNKGIDIQLRPAESIYSSAAGKVTFCDYLKGYGNTIIIEHSEGILTVYSGDLKTLVRLNERVAGGNKVASYASASPGRGGILHFEVRRGYKSQNPLYYLP